MADIKRLERKQKPCCYCGMKEEHPDFTCPRLSAVEMDDRGTTVHFVDPTEWKKHIEQLEEKPQ